MDDLGVVRAVFGQRVQAARALQIVGEGVVEDVMWSVFSSMSGSSTASVIVDRADDAEIESATISQRCPPDVDLGDFGVLREELTIGEIGSEQQERVAVLHRPISGGEADEPGHPDVIRIVVFDEFLAAQCVNGGRLEFAGELDDRVMRAGATGTAEQRHVLAAIQQR